MVHSDTDSAIDNIIDDNTDCEHKNSGPSVSVYCRKKKYSGKFNSGWLSRADFS